MLQIKPMVEEVEAAQLRTKSRIIRFADDVAPVATEESSSAAPTTVITPAELAQLAEPAAGTAPRRTKSRMIRFEAEPAALADYDRFVLVPLPEPEPASIPSAPPPAPALAQAAPVASILPTEPVDAATPDQPAEPVLVIEPVEEIPPAPPAARTEAALPAEPPQAPKHKLGSLKFYCRCGQKIMVRFPAPKPFGLCPRCRHRFDLPEGSFEYRPPAAPGH